MKRPPQKQRFKVTVFRLTEDGAIKSRESFFVQEDDSQEAIEYVRWMEGLSFKDMNTAMGVMRMNG